MKTILSVCRRNLAALMCMAIAIALFATPETAWAKKENRDTTLFSNGRYEQSA